MSYLTNSDQSYQPEGRLRTGHKAICEQRWRLSVDSASELFGLPGVGGVHLACELFILVPEFPQRGIKVRVWHHNGIGYRATTNMYLTGELEDFFYGSEGGPSAELALAPLLGRIRELLETEGPARIVSQVRFLPEDGAGEW
jgi:hypothetical protein